MLDLTEYYLITTRRAVQCFCAMFGERDVGDIRRLMTGALAKSDDPGRLRREYESGAAMMDYRLRLNTLGAEVVASVILSLREAPDGRKKCCFLVEIQPSDFGDNDGQPILGPGVVVGMRDFGRGSDSGRRAVVGIPAGVPSRDDCDVSVLGEGQLAGGREP